MASGRELAAARPAARRGSARCGRSASMVRRGHGPWAGRRSGKHTARCPPKKQPPAATQPLPRGARRPPPKASRDALRGAPHRERRAACEAGGEPALTTRARPFAAAPAAAADRAVRPEPRAWPRRPDLAIAGAPSSGAAPPRPPVASGPGRCYGARPSPAEDYDPPDRHLAVRLRPARRPADLRSDRPQHVFARAHRWPRESASAACRAALRGIATTCATCRSSQRWPPAPGGLPEGGSRPSPPARAAPIQDEHRPSRRSIVRGAVGEAGHRRARRRHQAVATASAPKSSCAVTAPTREALEGPTGSRYRRRRPPAHAGPWWNPRSSPRRLPHARCPRRPVHGNRPGALPVLTGSADRRQAAPRLLPRVLRRASAPWRPASTASSRSRTCAPG